MTIVPIDLGKDSNPARDKQGGSATLINCFAEYSGPEAKAPWAIYATDGLEGFTTLASAAGGVRAAVNVDGVLYCVAGLGVYKVTSNGFASLIGSMSISTTAPVKMRRNRRSTPDIGIVCDGLMYYVRADVLTQVTDVDLLAPIDMDFVDGYFGIITADNKWQIGAIDDASAWDALDFERADASPDAAVAIGTMQSQFLIFGEETCEFWRNTGNADFPFERVTVADVGCLASGSVQRIEQSVAFVAGDRTVRMFRGYDAARVSTHAIERDIEDLTDKSVLRSATWVKDGHTFYKLDAPGLWCWVYDVVTDKWHKRMSYGRNDWRVSTVTSVFGKLIAGDAAEGTLYEMSRSFTDEAGDALISTVITPPVHLFPYSSKHNWVHVDMLTGVGSGQGATQDINPTIELSWSEDGGATFGNAKQREIGQQGKGKDKVRFDRLGYAPTNGRVYKLSMSANVRRAFYALSADVERLAP